MKKEGMPKAVIGHERFEEKRIEKFSKRQEAEQPGWEQKENDPELDRLARELFKNSGIVDLAKEHAEELAEKYGTISHTPKEEFKRFENELGYNPVLVKKVFALYVSARKHEKAA